MSINKEMVDKLTIKNNEELAMAVKIPALPTRIMYGLQQSGSIRSFAVAKPAKFNDTTTITTVIVKSKIVGNPILNRMEEIDRTYTSGMFSGTHRGYLLNVLDDPTANSNFDIVSYISYRVPNVKIKESQLEGYRYFVVEEFNKILRMPVFVNEMQIESIGELPLNDIAYIKYIPGIVIGAGFNSHIGAIYVYTRKGNETVAVNSNLRSVNVKGYDKQKEFINPDYTNPTALTQADLRTTLYWNPSIMLDKINNKVSFQFYNNEVSKKLLLTIEGVNAAGEIIRIQKIVE
jgi:hypothetical protein